eukprot:4344328-Amphidinium_carterae.1
MEKGHPRDRGPGPSATLTRHPRLPPEKALRKRLSKESLKAKRTFKKKALRKSLSKESLKGKTETHLKEKG